MAVFDDVASAMGSLIGGDAVTGGWILGLVVVVSIFLILLIVAGKDGPSAGSLGAAIGLGFVLLVGWWPIWTAFFVLVLAGFAWWSRPQSTAGSGPV